MTHILMTPQCHNHISLEYTIIQTLFETLPTYSYITIYIHTYISTYIYIYIYISYIHIDQYLYVNLPLLLTPQHNNLTHQAFVLSSGHSYMSQGLLSNGKVPPPSCFIYVGPQRSPFFFFFFLLFFLMGTRIPQTVDIKTSAFCCQFVTQEILGFLSVNT
jgi:hypothetical protein